MNDRRLKVGGFILLLISFGGFILAGMLGYGAFHTDRIWKIALMVFGAIELLITAGFAFYVGKALIKGLPNVTEQDYYDEEY